MAELTNKETGLGIELATPAIVAMSSMVNLQELVRITDSGLEMHLLVKVSENNNNCDQCS
jgi:hypothetical protein